MTNPRTADGKAFGTIYQWTGATDTPAAGYLQFHWEWAFYWEMNVTGGPASALLVRMPYDTRAWSAGWRGVIVNRSDTVVSAKNVALYDGAGAAITNGTLTPGQHAKVFLLTKGTDVAPQGVWRVIKRANTGSAVRT